ncbi:PREDICTED: probable helicase MAGATAMA 3 [Ipomoea nil]|uniref:probable helicase MAGATAMA 3 n=1 Tax=Ipomoea nil TaxID=35883 RepID=UPI00090150F4|nr:PREDICTED: probable helicase MAGATAMA 3 [Ipomoea nil]
MTPTEKLPYHLKEFKQVKVLVIDEAAQLKECESTISMQLPGLCHAILIGDEKQFPSMVQSKICEKADFGRSFFERLVKLGHRKHLLNIQYRMHPSISLFPNKKFYDEKVMNGPNVMKIG